MYGVVVCSRCRRAKGVRVGQKTSLCQCGYKIDMSSARIMYRTNDARDLAKAVGVENARIRRGPEECKELARPSRRKRGIHGQVADAAQKAGSRDARMRIVAVELSKGLGTFTGDDFALVLVSMGIANPQKRLEELVESNFVYQPSPGIYKTV